MKINAIKLNVERVQCMFWIFMSTLTFLDDLLTLFTLEYIHYLFISLFGLNIHTYS